MNHPSGSVSVWMLACATCRPSCPTSALFLRPVRPLGGSAPGPLRPIPALFSTTARSCYMMVTNFIRQSPSSQSRASWPRNRVDGSAKRGPTCEEATLLSRGELLRPDSQSDEYHVTRFRPLASPPTREMSEPALVRSPRSLPVALTLCGFGAGRLTPRVAGASARTVEATSS